MWKAAHAAMGPRVLLGDAARLGGSVGILLPPARHALHIGLSQNHPQAPSLPARLLPNLLKTGTGCLVTSGQWLIHLTMLGGSDPAPPWQPQAHEAALPRGLLTALCTQPTAPTPF